MPKKQALTNSSRDYFHQGNQGIRSHYTPIESVLKSHSSQKLAVPRFIFSRGIPPGRTPHSTAPVEVEVKPSWSRLPEDSLAWEGERTLGPSISELHWEKPLVVMEVQVRETAAMEERKGQRVAGSGVG